jgi:hypothetical protein
MKRYRILVLDARSPIALAACESLAREGHELGVTCVNRLELAAVSRYAYRHHVLPSPEGPAEPYFAELLRTIDRFGYEVVFAVRDPAIARLAEIELPVPSCPPSGGVVLPLINKLDLRDVCVSSGVAYPATFAPPEPDDDENALNAAGFPAFVKAWRSAWTTPDRVVHLTGATEVFDLSTGLRVIADIRRAGVQPLVQETLRGEKFHAAVIRRRGRTDFRYAHRYLRQFGGGYEVALETLLADRGAGGEATDVLERICDATGYEGLVQAEFFLAHRDGRVYLFDVNPRLWGSVWFPERLGLRVAERAARDVLGEPPLNEAHYRAGLRYHNVLGELRFAYADPRRVPSMLRSFRVSDVYHPSPLRDPLPAALWLGQKLLRVARR